MPVPLQYDAAGPQFQQLLRDARDVAGLTTRNQSYTMLEGVLLTFRKRLDVAQVVQFADVLPAVARAVFVGRWDPDEPVVPYLDRAAMTIEVQQLRPLHNYAPDHAISAVATAMRRNVDEQRFNACLARLGPEATDYWTPTDPDDWREPTEFAGTVTMARDFVRPPRVARPESSS